MLGVRNLKWGTMARVALAALFSVVMVVTGIVMPGTANAAPKLTTVELGLATPSMLYLPIYVAIANGYFQKHGIAIQQVTISNSIPLISGSVQVQASTVDTALIDASKGQPTPVIATMQQENQVGIYVRSDLATASRTYPKNVEGLKALGNFTVGVASLASGSAPLLLGSFASAGLTQGTNYTVTQGLSGANLIAAFRAKRVQVGLLYPPYDAQATAAGLVKLLVLPGKLGPQFLTQLYGASLLANQSWANSNPKLASGVNAAITQADAFTHNYPKNKAALIKIVKKYIGVTDTSTISPSLASIAMLATPEISCAKVNTQAHLDTQYGVITAPPSCADTVLQKVFPKALVSK